MYGATYHMPQDGKYLGLACLYLISCVVVVSWMMISGPMAVPRQDTRITNIIISIASKGALGLGLWIVTLRLRVQWTHILVSEEPVSSALYSPHAAKREVSRAFATSTLHPRAG